MNKFLEKTLNSKRFQYTILAIILFNAIIIGLDTYPRISNKFGDLIAQLNYFCLMIFTAEILVKIYVRKTTFIKNGWNVFDLVIIAISLTAELGAVSVFRTFRLIRILRLISLIPRMQLISTTLIRSLYSMFGVATLLSLIFYIYAVTTTQFYGEDFPQWFGSLGESSYTLFQIMTFESWSMSIVRPVMEIYPNSWIVFISFILIASYIVLNIVIGVIVDCIGEIKDAQEVQKREDSELLLIAKINKLENELLEIKQLLKQKS